MIQDTIAGISTAVGNAGIAIIRISGNEAFTIADSLFRGNQKVEAQASHTLQYGKIVVPDGGETIDEVLLIKMEAPRTYTRENIVEIHCHGGHVVTGRILSLVLKAGARPAEPGEFTKRAFFNGRIDLSQAEAIMDIIQARTQTGSRAAVRQLEGSLSLRLSNLRGLLVDILSKIEVNLDYPEYDAEEITATQARKTAGQVLNEITSLINSFHYGKILREGLHVVIAGRPNVGKSSLMNRLSRKNKSIVTEIPGTTRDIIEESINIKGIPILLADTAGIRETEDQVERIGVERSEAALQNADFIVLLMDASRPLDWEDQRLIERVADSGDPYILVFNKIDLVEKEALSALKNHYPECILMTLKNDEGVEELEEGLFRYATEKAQNLEGDVLITNARHERQLHRAKEALEAAISACDAGLTMDIVALELNRALEEIGAITGHHAAQEVLDAVFSRFCLGK